MKASHFAVGEDPGSGEAKAKHVRVVTVEQELLSVVYKEWKLVRRWLVVSLGRYMEMLFPQTEHGEMCKSFQYPDVSRDTHFV